MNLLYVSIIYLILDVLWIYIMTPLHFGKTFQMIQKTPIKFNLIYAVLAYITLLCAIRFICIPLRSTYKTNKWFAFTLVGFIIYAVYDLTNAAVFTNYSYPTVIIDVLWGTFIFTLLGLILD